MISEKNIEWLDGDNQPIEDLEIVLSQLQWINKYLGNLDALKMGVSILSIDLSKDRPIRIIDIGCGLGENLTQIGRFLEGKGYSVELLGLDKNETIIQLAKSKTDRITFFQEDVLDAESVIPECDIIMISHFIYHLREQQLFKLFNKAKNSVKVGIVMSELYPSKMAALGLKLLSFVRGFHPMVVSDGLKALDSSYTLSDWRRVMSISGVSFNVMLKPFYRHLTIITSRME